MPASEAICSHRYPEKCQSEWVYVSDILEQTYTAEVGKTMSVNVGENKLSDI